ncbi:hypothetical protein ACOMHN_041641 [Nucella lapillus]
MDSGRSGTPPEYLVNANERQYLAKLCWLLQDAGTRALRATFDSFHPSLHLRQHLSQHHVRTLLRKLHEQKLFSDKQWRTLYPTRKQEIAELSSDKFDARILAVLLQFICHLSPPYPHGWSTLPLPQDSSLSGDVVRLQMYLQQAGSLSGVRHEEYPVLWKQIVEVLLRMGGPEVRVKITRIDQETLTPEQQGHYISLVKNSWGAPDEGALGRLRKMGAGRFVGGRSGAGRGCSFNKRRPGDKSSDQEGISPEERVVLSKCQRQLCDVVMAEEIVDRLVQGHVINFADRQEILTPGKNQDRMQILLSKICQSKMTAAFRVLSDNLKLKYPRVHEAMGKVYRTVQREGVSQIVDAAAVCQEGLAAHYLSLFSRVTPLPWSEAQASIRDVYVPLEVASEDGQKLQLSTILPPVVTSGRGKRVLVEGESGSGKTYLAAMLTYQWASQRAYFNSQYQFFVYLDARLIKGPLAKAVHSLVFPENFRVGPDEFWGLLETHARETMFLIDGFDEDHSHDELKKVILGDKLRHASVLLTSRPEARAARWLNPDDRLYVLGLSDVNIGRCLKSYAVIAQMTSEEYERFHDVIQSPGFGIRAQLANPYVCLLVFGVYLANGRQGLGQDQGLSTLTSLLQRFLVATATTFLQKLGTEAEDEVGGGIQISPELVTGISELQSLAYRSMVTRGKLLTEGDLSPVLRHIRAALEAPDLPKEEDRVRKKREKDVVEDDAVEGQGGEEEEGGGGGGAEEGEEEGGGEEEDVKKELSAASKQEKQKKRATKVQTMVNVTDSQLLTRAGVLHKIGGGGGGGGGRWAFTCSMTREFLAARHLADLPGEKLDEALKEQKVLRHPRLAQTASFLCSLLQGDPDPRVLGSLLEDISIQVLKHGRKINFKDDASSINGHPSEDGEEGDVNGVGSQITNFSHCLQALAECSSSSSSASSSSSTTASSSSSTGSQLSNPSTELPKSLPKAMIVQRDGLIPVKCLQGLALAVESPLYHLTTLHIELLPFQVYQSQVFQTLAQALSENQHLQNVVIRWHRLPLAVDFLKACLVKAPALSSVVLEDVSRQSVVKNVSASTWANLQEACSLLKNTRSFSLVDCGSAHVVAQWVNYLPNTIRAMQFKGCAFNSISAANLGSKLEKSEDCVTLNLADTFLQTSDLSALFHDLKLNSSLQNLSFAGSHLDRSAADSLAEYIRLNSSLHRLNLSRCHVTTKACRLLAAAMTGNYSLQTLDFTDAEVSNEGREVLMATREGEITWLGFEEECYS